MGDFLRLFRAAQNDIKSMHFSFRIFFSTSEGGVRSCTLKWWMCQNNNPNFVFFAEDLKNGTNHVPLTQSHNKM